MITLLRENFATFYFVKIDARNCLSSLLYTTFKYTLKKDRQSCFQSTGRLKVATMIATWKNFISSMARNRSSKISKFCMIFENEIPHLYR